MIWVSQDVIYIRVNVYFCTLFKFGLKLLLIRPLLMFKMGEALVGCQRPLSPDRSLIKHRKGKLTVLD